MRGIRRPHFDYRYRKTPPYGSRVHSRWRIGNFTSDILHITGQPASLLSSSLPSSSLSFMRCYVKRSDPDAAATAKVDAPVLRYRVYANRVRRMLLLGCVLQEQARTVGRSYATGLLVIVMCFSQFVFVMNFCREHTDNLVLTAKCLGLASSFIAPVLMSCCFLAKRGKLIELHETLDELFERELAHDRSSSTYMLGPLYMFDSPSYVFIVMLSTTAMAIIWPSASNIIRPLIFHSATRTGVYRWPYPVKFPWSVPSGGYLFYLQYLYQMSTCWWMVFTIGGVDSLFGFYAFQIFSILRAMAVRSANPRPGELFSQVLRTCVETHHRLLRCVRTLEDLYGIIIIRTILTNAILMCALIFEASLFTDMKADQACLFISYMVLKVLQTFIYAWYGSLVTSASERFREGIYFGGWPDTDLGRSVRANLIMTMMQKPMVITALKVSSVNINMFTNVLNTTMSYFFLLRSLDEPK